MKAVSCCVAFCLLISGSVFVGTCAFADTAPEDQQFFSCDHPFVCWTNWSCLIVQECNPIKQPGYVREVWLDGRCMYQGQWNLQCCGSINFIGECGYPT
jgi:hypothetical protein